MRIASFAGRLAASIIGLAALAATAVAGDFSDRNILGFSPDGAYFAFEEYGEQDGSGFAYADIFIVRVADDSWVDGTPVREHPDDADVTLETVRKKVRERAQPILDRLQIHQPGYEIVSNPLAEVSDAHKVRFLVRPFAFRPPDFGGSYEGVWTLELAEREVPAGDCTGDLGFPVRGYELTLTDADGKRRTLHTEDRVPASRGCPTTYAISEVQTFEVGDGSLSMAVLISMFPFGFEGPDRRYLAVTAPLER